MFSFFYTFAKIIYYPYTIHTLFSILFMKKKLENNIDKDQPFSHTSPAFKKIFIIKKTTKIPSQIFEFTWTGIDWLDGDAIRDLIQQCFGEDFMNDVKVKDICCDNQIYYLHDWINSFLDTWLIPVHEFSSKYEKADEQEKLRLLDNVFAWNSSAVKWVYTPINIFNQDYVFEVVMAKAGKPLDYAEVEYFEGVNCDDIPTLYKIWTIVHEIWHHIFEEKIDWTDLMQKWTTVIDQTWPLTKYAKVYAEKWILYYNENMWEAIRIFITNRPYLQQNFPAVDVFITKYFPMIHPYINKKN